MAKTPPKINKTRLASLIALAFIVLIFILGFIPFSFPVIQNTIEEKVHTLTEGDSLTMENLAFSLWQGVTLSNVHFATGPKNENNIKADIPQIKVSYRMLPLLWGKFQLDKISIIKPQADIKLPATKKQKKKEEESTLLIDFLTGKLSLDLPLTIDIKKLNVEEASFDVKVPDVGILRGEKLDLKLKASLGDELTARGSLKIENLWAPEPFKITDFKSDILLTPEQVGLTDGSFKFCGGKGEFDILTDASSDTLLNMQIAMKRLDLGTLMKLVQFDKGTISGKAGLTMNIVGSDLETKNLKGRGSFTVNNFTATGLPMQKKLSMVLLMPKFKKLEFSTIRSSMILGKERLRTPDLTGTGNVLNFAGSGWVNLNKFTRQNINLSFSREFCSRLPRLVSREILLKGKGGRCDLKAKVSGPLNNLKIDVDKKIKQNAAKKAIEGGFKALKHFFKKK